MDFTGVNTIAVVAAAVASFAFGAAWYMTLAKHWMAALGKTEEELKADSSPVPFIIAAVCQVLMAFVLAGLCGALGMTDVGGSVVVALVAWAGFVLTTLAVNHGFQGMPRMMTLIDGGHWLGVVIIQAVVIALVSGWMAA